MYNIFSSGQWIYIPFDVRLEYLNQETIAAMLKAEQMVRDPSVKRYLNASGALRVLKG